MLKIESVKSIATRCVAFSLVLTVSPVYTGNAQAQGVRAKASAAHRATVRPVAGHPPGGVRPAQASSAVITAYLNRLRGKIIREWIIPDGNNHVTLTGNFNQDGLSDNIKTTSSPHNDNAEGAATMAFNKCMPLETPPLGMTNGKLTVDFLSKADPHGDSSTSVNLRLDPAPAPRPEAATAPGAQPAAASTTPDYSGAAQNAAPAQTAAPAAVEVTPPASTVTAPTAAPAAVPDATSVTLPVTAPVTAPATARQEVPAPPPATVAPAATTSPPAATQPAATDVFAK